jgi:hypothetical protein
MPNQMIALQARNPQLPDPQQRTARMANMMNMARQAEAAQLQGQRIRQEMDYAQAGETRAAETQRAELRAKNQSFRVAEMKELRNRGVAILQSGSEPAYQLWLNQLDVVDPDSAAVARQIAPTLGDGKAMRFLLNEADKFIENNTSKRKSEIYTDEAGIPILVESGGDTDYEATPIVATRIRDVNQPPRATPTAPPAAAGTDVDMRATRGANTTPQDLINQGMNPNNIPSGMPTSRPVSFNQSDMGGAGAMQMTPDVMSRIVDSAFQTGVMAQVDFDQLLASQPPQNKQALMNAFQQANIKLQADAPSLADSGIGQQPMAANPVQRPQSQFADLRGPAPQSQTAGLRGAPPMEQTLAQYQVGQQIKGRNPSIPPSANVDLSRVAAEAAAQQRTPAQIKAQKIAELQATEDFEEANKASRLARKAEEVYATKRAEKDADFLETYNDTVSKSRNTLNALDQMIGDARIERDRIVIPKGGRRPHGGFEGVVGAGIPGVRFFEGTQAADFDALLEQVQDGAFLKAFNDLKGGGSITQIEGEKATMALTRVKRAQSEIGFVKAAREFVEILRDGIKNADKRYARLTGETPAAAPVRRKTPTKGSDGWGQAKVVGN